MTASATATAQTDGAISVEFPNPSRRSGRLTSPEWSAGRCIPDSDLDAPFLNQNGSDRLSGTPVRAGTTLPWTLRGIESPLPAFAGVIRLPSTWCKFAVSIPRWHGDVLAPVVRTTVPPRPGKAAVTLPDARNKRLAFWTAGWMNATLWRSTCRLSRCVPATAPRRRMPMGFPRGPFDASDQKRQARELRCPSRVVSARLAFPEAPVKPRAISKEAKMAGYRR